MKYRKKTKQKNQRSQKLNLWKRLLKLLKLNKTSLTDQDKKQQQRKQINNIRHERGNITMDLTEMERLISKHDEWLSVNKFDNLDETDKFPEKYTL